MKTTIVGMGNVGATLAHTLCTQGTTDELVLFNRTYDIAQGHALDLAHANAFLPHRINVAAGNIQDTKNSDVVIITASAPRTPDILDRRDLAAPNIKLIDQILPPLVEQSPAAIYIFITNPVDAITYHALQITDLDPSKVIGTGTIIDSARWRDLLSKELQIHPEDLRAYILGEHGSSQFPAFSIAVAGGQRIDQSTRLEQLFNQGMNSANEIISKKGYTNFAIASATALILEAIYNNTYRTIPVSVLIDGYLGIENTCLSIPAIIGRQGVVRQLYPSLNEDEQQKFIKCAQAVKATYAYATQK